MFVELKNGFRQIYLSVFVNCRILNHVSETCFYHFLLFVEFLTIFRQHILLDLNKWNWGEINVGYDIVTPIYFECQMWGLLDVMSSKTW